MHCVGGRAGGMWIQEIKIIFIRSTSRTSTNRINKTNRLNWGQKIQPKPKHAVVFVYKMGPERVAVGLLASLGTVRYILARVWSIYNQVLGAHLLPVFNHTHKLTPGYPITFVPTTKQTKSQWNTSYGEEQSPASPSTPMSRPPLSSSFMCWREGALSHTSPQAARGGWGCPAQTSGSCASPPGPGAETSPAPPGTGPWCPRPQTPVVQNTYRSATRGATRPIHVSHQRSHQTHVRHKRSHHTSSLTLICTRKSLRCSLKAGMSWFRLNKPVTNTFTWALHREHRHLEQSLIAIQSHTTRTATGPDDNTFSHSTTGPDDTTR